MLWDVVHKVVPFYRFQECLISIRIVLPHGIQIILESCHRNDNRNSTEAVEVKHRAKVVRELLARKLVDRSPDYITTRLSIVGRELQFHCVASSHTQLTLEYTWDQHSESLFRPCLLKCISTVEVIGDVVGILEVRSCRSRVKWQFVA